MLSFFLLRHFFSNQSLFKCDKSRALRYVITDLSLLVHSISVTKIKFLSHSRVKQLEKIIVAYFGKRLPIKFKWQYSHLTQSIPHVQTLRRHRNNTGWIYWNCFIMSKENFWTSFRLYLHTYTRTRTEREREREREQIKHELSDSECSGLKVTV